MKKSSFAGLLYREFYLGKPSYIIQLIIFLMFALVGLLAVLSMNSGNLKLLLSEDVIADRSQAEELRKALISCIRLFPASMIGTFIFGPADVASKDAMILWERYEHCTPVTPKMYALVKLIATVAVSAFAFLLSFLYLFVTDIALGEKTTNFGYIFVFLLLTFFIVFNVLAQIFITFFRSRDVGMIVSMLVMIGGLSAVSVFINSKGESMADDQVMDLSEIAEAIHDKLPIMLILIFLVYVLFFVSMYLLYKRREK